TGHDLGGQRPRRPRSASRRPPRCAKARHRGPLRRRRHTSSPPRPLGRGRNPRPQTCTRKSHRRIRATVPRHPLRWPLRQLVSWLAAGSLPLPATWHLARRTGLNLELYVSTCQSIALCCHCDVSHVLPRPDIHPASECASKAELLRTTEVALAG